MVAEAVAAGVVFVSAAGNNGQDIDISPRYPASAPGSLTVGASSVSDTLAPFSNFGSRGGSAPAPTRPPTSPFWCGLDGLPLLLDALRA